MQASRKESVWEHVGSSVPPVVGATGAPDASGNCERPPCDKPCPNSLRAVYPSPMGRGRSRVRAAPTAIGGRLRRAKIAPMAHEKHASPENASPGPNRPPDIIVAGNRQSSENINLIPSVSETELGWARLSTSGFAGSADAGPAAGLLVVEDRWIIEEAQLCEAGPRQWQWLPIAERVAFPQAMAARPVWRRSTRRRVGEPGRCILCPSFLVEAGAFAPSGGSSR